VAGTSRLYGNFWDGTRYVYSHRFSYELANGPVPEGLELDHRHTCPKICVNPDHLRPATRKENMENRAGVTKASRSGVRGVRLYKGRWQARIRHNRKDIHVGSFDTVEQAEAAVIAKRLELFTHNDRDRESV
jgi:hypothetical protein